MLHLFKKQFIWVIDKAKGTKAGVVFGISVQKWLTYMQPKGPRFFFNCLSFILERWIRYAVPRLRQTPVDDVQEVHYYHTCKQCCKGLFNLLTSRTAVGLRQEFDRMFQAFVRCHCLQLIQWEEEAYDC